MYTDGVTELRFQMYNVTVRCKKGNLLASCHLAHCIAIFFPHIMTIVMFCMYVHWYNLTLPSTALGIKRGNILLSNSYLRFPSSTTSVILSEMRLIFLHKHIQKCIWWSGNNASCFYLSSLCSFATCIPSLVISSRRQVFTTKPEQNIADTVSFQYVCSSHKIIFYTNE